MCLYVPSKQFQTVKEELGPYYKLVIKKEDGFYSYFSSSIKLELDTILTNDSPIKFKETHDPWPENLYVSSGVFHAFTERRPLYNCLNEYKRHEESIDNLYVLNAFIPENAKYIKGFTCSFSMELERTIGSTQIIYKDPMPLIEFCK